MLRPRSQLNMCEQEVKFVQERITQVEKHFNKLHNSFAAYTKEVAELRDKNDALSKIIEEYAKSEKINKSLSRGLFSFAETLSIIGDYRDAEVKRLDSKVIAPLTQYSMICKHAKDSVKSTFDAHNKERLRQRNFDKVREKNSHDRQIIFQAESELLKATDEVTRVVKNLEEDIDSFERRKLRDIKTLLLDFITIGLSFHAKALENLTKAYQDVAEIDEIKDLQEFREGLRSSDTIARLDTVGRTSFRRGYSSSSNLTSRLSSSPFSFKKDTRKATSLDSLKHKLSNSAESIQVEEYPTNSEDDDVNDDNDDDDDESESGETDSTEESTVRSKFKSL